MKLTLFLVLCSLFIHLSLSDNSGNCNIDEVNFVTGFYQSVNDSDTNKVINTLINKGTLVGVSCDSTYFDFKINSENNLEILTTADFENFEKDYAANNSIAEVYGDQLKYSMDCIITCDGDSELSVTFVISDINEHAPTFDKSDYTFTIPMPIMPKVEVTGYGDSIKATDLDFSEKEITFTVEPDDFDITSSLNEHDHVFIPVLKIKKLLSKDATYTITATDSGTPSLPGTTAQFVIKEDTDNSLDIPLFKSAGYEFDYKIDHETQKPVLVPKSGDITYTTTKSNLIDPKLSGASKDYFEVEADTETNTISLSLKDDNELPDDNKVILLNLAIETDFVAQTTLIIYLPDPSSEDAPKFDKSYYTAQYTENNKVVPIDVIYVEAKTALTFTLSNYNDTFTPEYDDQTKICTLAVNNNLDTDKSTIVFTLTAEASGVSSTVTIIMYLPIAAEKLQFSLPLFKADYKHGSSSDKDLVEIDAGTPINVVTDKEETVTITAEDAYKENFKFEYDTSKKIWSVTVSKNLPDSILDKQTELVVTITASQDSKEGEAVLVLTLPTKTSQDAPEFALLHYTGTYNNDETNPNVSLDSDIAIKNGKDLSKITISLDGNYKDNFHVEFDSSNNKGTIVVDNPLDETVLQSEVSLVLSLIAVEDGNTNKGEAVLVVNLPKDEAKKSIKFSQIYYTGEYTLENKEPTVTLSTPISVANFDFSKVTLQVNNSVDYASYFSLTKNTETNDWSVKCDELPTDVVNKKSLVMSILAVDDEDADIVGESTLVVTTSPKSDTLKFSSVNYAGIYEVDNGAATVKLNNPISVHDVDFDKVSLELDSSVDYAKYFHLKSDAANKQWTIESDVLPADVVSKKTLVMTIVATDSDTNNTGEATLVVTTDPATTISFSYSFYSGKYKIDSDDKTSVTLDNPIKVQDIDFAKVTVTFDSSIEYAKYFKLVADSDKKQWTVQSDKLPDDVLQKQSVILTITATEQDTSNVGQTTLVINTDLSGSIKFSSSNYAGIYAVDNGAATVELNNPISVQDVDFDKVSLELDSSVGYAKYFHLKTDAANKQWTIESDVLPADVVSKKTLVMTIVATDSDTKNTGEATLVVTTDPATTISFSYSFYSGKYKIDSDDKTSVILDNPIKVQDVDFAKVTVTFDSSIKYAKYFKLVADTDKEQWTVQSDKLPDDVLQKKSLILTVIATEQDTSNVGQTTLVITTDISNTLKFSSPYYTGNYSTNNEKATVTLDNEITIKDADFTKITLKLDSSVDYANYFKLTKGKQEWTVESEVLPTEVLQERSLAMLILATEDDSDDTGVATLVIKLPALSDSPVFSSAYYTANYTLDGDTASVSLDSPIEVTNVDFDKISLTLNSYGEYFKLKADSTKGQWTIEAKVLPVDILEQQISLVLDISATNEDTGNIGKSAIVVNLPEKDPMKFSSPHYTADYSVVDGKPNIILEQEISLTKDVEQIDLNNYTTYFQLSKDQGSGSEWTLVASIPPAEILKLNSLVMTMSAQTADGFDSAEAALVVMLPKNDESKAPQFSKTQYTGTYEVTNDKPSVVMDDIVVTYQDLDKVKVTINSFTGNFSVKQSDDDKKVWTVHVENPLSSETLKHETNLVIILTATETDAGSTSDATLVINLPKSEAPMFSQSHYTGKYLALADKTTVTLDEPITISNKKSDNVQIEQDKFSENFQLVYDESKEQWNSVKVIKPLDNWNTTEIAITLTASVEDTLPTGLAVLLISLPDPPEFTQTNYRASYVISDGKGSLIDNNIELVDSTVGITLVELDNYTEYFFLKPENDYYSIQVNNSLPDEILEKQESLVATITAHTSDSFGKATLVVLLPRVVEPRAISFEDVYYNAKYVHKENGKDELDISSTIKLKIEKDDAVVSLSLEDSYGKYFTCSLTNENAVSLSVKDNIPDDDLSSLTDFKLVIVATVKGTTDSTKTAVFVSCPKKESTDDSDDSNTGLIAGIAVLAVLLAAYIAGTVAFYWFKIRNKRYSEMEEEFGETENASRYSKNLKSTTKSEAIETRRPTGYIFNTPKDDILESSDDVDDEKKDRRKSVAFNDNIEKMQIESVNDEDDFTDGESVNDDNSKKNDADLENNENTYL